MRRAEPGRLLVAVVAAIAIAKIVGGLLGVARAPGFLVVDAAPLLPAWPYLLQVLFYSAAAWLLWYGGREDPRSRRLVIVWLLIASAFANRLLADGWRSATEPLGTIATGLASIPVDAFLPYALWRFAAEFPRVPLLGVARRLPRRMGQLGLALGVILVGGNLVIGLLGSARRDLPLVRIVETLTLKRAAGFYWVIVFLLVLGALAFIQWKARRAPVAERRRVRLFVTGLIIGALPITIAVLLEILIRPFAAWMEQSRGSAVVSAAVLTALLSVPVTTTYSVLAHRALDVRLVLRRALQYVLARYTIIAAIAVPFAGLAFLVIAGRDRPLVEVVRGTNAFSLLLVGGAAAIAYAVRRPVLETLDRRFFREQYDARMILSRLVERTRNCESAEDLAELLCCEIDRALHVTRAAALFFDPLTQQLLEPNGRCRGLELRSRLARHALSQGGPVNVDLEHPQSATRDLSRNDRVWLADGDFRLLVPLVRSERELLGLIALGHKKSELPFSGADLELLADVAASGALALENRLLRSSQSSRPSADGKMVSATIPAIEDPALECVRCGAVHSGKAQRCRDCDGRLAPAVVPRVLNGKFRLEQRVGKGAMGVVYRALDLDLRRAIAIKTLPRVSPRQAVRLRREARAMAAIRHANLAVIYSVESWHGVPLLILEYLGGGTLAERLRRGPVEIDEAMETTRALGEALDGAHRAGVLHRDVKPSNVGFDIDGTVKLLDFGLAHLWADSTAGPVPADPDRPDANGGSETAEPLLASGDPTMTAVMHTTSGYLVGTPLYLSPEAVRRRPPDPSFDLWALATVLYEMLAGSHPLLLGGRTFSLDVVRRAEIPPIRNVRAEVPRALADFVHRALSHRRSERPGSARQFLDGLRAAREGRSSQPGE